MPGSVDPTWEALDRSMSFKATASFALAVERAAARHRVAVSVLLREAVRRGLPALVNDIEILRGRGFVSPAAIARRLGEGLPRSPSGEGVVSARWTKLPGGSPEEPPLPEPEVDRD